MTIDFNKLNRYELIIGKKLQQESKETKETEEVKEAVVYEAFKGLKNETDLLTKNAQALYGVQISRYTAEDKELAEKTNEILASLGYNYKVSAAQVASVSNGVKTVVQPGMKLAEDGAVAAHIMDPNGPFADLFAQDL